MNGAAVVEDRAGITFGVELYVPWDAPEAVVDIASAVVVPLRHIPDVIGLVGRREGAAESRVLQGRDVRSVGVLVPDCRGVDQNIHDVTILDMGDVPESHISLSELSTLSQQWHPAVISHMGWRQKELKEKRAAAKKRFRQSRPSCCMYCGVLIKCDMHRHVAWFHFDLAQLWRSRSRGAPCGRARHRTVWITFVAPMMFRGRLSRPTWRSTSLLGQLRGKCGQICWRLSTRRMCCCLVTSTSPWCTTTESTSVVFLILLSGRTICHSYALCCRCRQSRRRSGWYRLTPPARVRCVRLGLRRSWIDLLGRTDVPSGVGDWYGLWSHPWRTFRSS